MQRPLMTALMIISLTVLGPLPHAVSSSGPQALRAPQTAVPNPHCPDCITGLILRACGLQITRPGIYRLAADLGPCAGDGVDIRATGVVLNLAGFTVRGSGTG